MIFLIFYHSPQKFGFLIVPSAMHFTFITVALAASIALHIFIAFPTLSKYASSLSRMPKHQESSLLAAAINASISMEAMKKTLADAQTTSATLNATVENLNREIAELQEALVVAQIINTALNVTVGNLGLATSMQKSSAESASSGIILKPHMTRLEWKSFVAQQLHSTSNFAAAQYARWSRYLNKEWINDDYKTTIPKAMEWDNCLNGQEYCVISLGLYAHEASYLKFIAKRLPLYRDAMDIFYPGWRLRLYYDESVPFSVLESVAARGVETIQVTDFKGQIAGMFWRFFVADDLEVDRYLVRDLDSDFGWRERTAVDEWIRSNLSFHSMADAENHAVPIMGGMWGGSAKRRLPFSVKEQAQQHQQSAGYKGGDQDFLAAVVWPAWLQSG
jgi:hypothetical protein